MSSSASVGRPKSSVKFAELTLLDYLKDPWIFALVFGELAILLSCI